MGCYLIWETFCADGELEFVSLLLLSLSNMRNTGVTIRKFICNNYIDMSHYIYFQNLIINVIKYEMNDFRCWLQIDRAIMLGQYTPIALMVIITIMLIEAAGSVDESTMKKLPRKYKFLTLLTRNIFFFDIKFITIVKLIIITPIHQLRLPKS